MPIVKTVKGDLLAMFKEKQFDIIVHGANCYHLMGAGIAGQIAREFPEAYQEDLKTRFGDESKLGSMSMVMTEYGIIVNLYTQFKPGKIKNTYKLVELIEEGFIKINNASLGLTIGIPRIGAGIAGGYWPIIRNAIDRITPNINVVVVEFDK